MDQKAQTLLKALLVRSHNSDALLHFLPATLADAIQDVSLADTFDPKKLLSSSHWSTNVHYSWFSEIIKEYPDTVKYLFLGALTAIQAEGIRQMLTLSGQLPRSSRFLQPFLLNILRRALEESDLLNEQLLPPSPMNCLLELQRKYLFYMPDLLGLYDLSTDLRQVVDKEILRKIHAVLTQEQLHFLNYCSKQPLKWVSPKLGLPAWNGTRAQLKSILHYRGLIRLAKATIQENSHFKWHLLHRMDVGRAKIMRKEFYQKQDPSLLSYFKNQVLHVAKKYHQ